VEAGSFVRFRWRLRGAWLWPTFVVLTVVDGLLIHWHPLLGDSAPLIGGWLIGVFATLIATVLLSPGLGRLLRMARTDMPRLVARNYAGAMITVAITLVILGVGVVHSHVIARDTADLQDATARAEAYIGAHAPRKFQAHLAELSTYEVQPPRIYRVCASNTADTQTYCVVVDRYRPFGKSVKFSGDEPNSLLSQGTS
jgi:hypothetical protein